LTPNRVINAFSTLQLIRATRIFSSGTDECSVMAMFW
jgi:hypothetical protein